MIKKNFKTTKKSKLEKYTKWLKLQEKLDRIGNMVVNSLKKRCDEDCKASSSKDLKIKQVQDDFDQLKELVQWYHKDLIKENFDKEEAFNHALTMPYNNGINRLSYFQNEIGKFKTIDAKTIFKMEYEDKFMLSERTNLDSNLPEVLDSSDNSKIQLNCLSPLHLKYDPTKLLASRKIDNESVSSSDTSYSGSLNESTIYNPNRDTSIFEWHKFDQKRPVSNKHCNACSQKEPVVPTTPVSKKSALSNKQLILFHCKRCGMCVHDFCRGLVNRKICIPCPKINVKVSGNREIDLIDLCLNIERRPYVPSVLLCLMNHIQTYNYQAEGLYRASSRNKSVVDLCEKLFSGKPKHLARHDIQTAGNCLKLILRSLKSPLIPDNVAKQLLDCIETSSSQSQFIAVLSNCMKNELDEPNLDTFVYLIVHLKIVTEMESCRLDSSSIATLFMPSLTSDGIAGVHCRKLIEVIRKIIDLEYVFFEQYMCENIFFQHSALKSMLVSRM